MRQQPPTDRTDTFSWGQLLLYIHLTPQASIDIHTQLHEPSKLQDCCHDRLSIDIRIVCIKMKFNICKALYHHDGQFRKITKAYNCITPEMILIHMYYHKHRCCQTIYVHIYRFRCSKFLRKCWRTFYACNHCKSFSINLNVNNVHVFLQRSERSLAEDIFNYFLLSNLELSVNIPVPLQNTIIHFYLCTFHIFN